MNNVTSFKILIILLNLSLIIISLISDEIPDGLQSKYAEKREFKQEVYNNTLKFIKENPDSPKLALSYFNLAELSIEIDVNEPEKTLDYFQKVLEYDPNHEREDVVYYNIGYYSYLVELNRRNEKRLKNLDQAINWPSEMRLNEKELEISISAFKKLMNDFPESAYHTESIYRLGTIYFEIAMDAREPQSYFQKAIEYFDLVARNPEDPLYHYGLFQRGWSYFSSGDFEKSIEDFTKILDIINTDGSSLKKALFEADAIDNIAFSLIEYDGTDYEKESIASEKAREIFINYVTDQYAKKILRKAIELELKYSAPMRAVDIYNSYIWLYPQSLECPSYIDSIVTLYTNYPSRVRQDLDPQELVIKEKIRLIRDYRTDSQWYVQNLANDIEPQLAIIREAYEFMDSKYYNNFVREMNEDNYLIYDDLVENYGLYPSFMDADGIERFRSMRIRRIEISANLAELSQKPAYYFFVINNIEAFNVDYPDHENYYNYEEDKFYSSEKIYQLLIDDVKENVFIDSIHNIYLDQDQLESFYIASSINYETMLNSPQFSSDYKENELIRITQLRAELRYFRNELDEAYNDYSTLLTYDLNNDLRTEAYARMAEISREREDFVSEEQYYREAIKYALPEEKEAFNNNILAAIQSGADKFVDQTDYNLAAQEYLRLANEIEDSNPEKSISFRMKAIESYKQGEQYQDAIDQYLEVASRVSGKQKVFTAYLGAWSISDTLLADWDQSEKLRNSFISRYPNSNEAYKLRLQVIRFYEDENKFDDKEQAAKLYLKLHEDADNLDLREDKKENIYLKALRLYQDMGNDDKSVELMLEFERMYPEHPLANDFLRKVALIYDQRGEEKKYEDLAEYIFTKDPSIDLYTTIVAEKLAKINLEVDSLFYAGEYDSMMEKIGEFKEVDEQYKQNGGDLDLNSFYDQFQYYSNYVDFYQRFDARIDYVNNEFLNSTPDQLIKVNELTQWKKHLIDGKRIENLMKKNDSISRDVIELIKEGNDYDLPTESRTQALYLAAKAYDYSSQIVEIQVQKFVDVSNQLNNEQMRANPTQQREYKQNLLGIGKNMAYEFKKKAGELYQSLLKTFYDEKEYSDKWTELAYEQLVQWGVRQPKIFVNHYLTNDWKIGLNKGIAELPNLQDTTYWKQIDFIPEKMLLDSSQVAMFEGNKSWLISRNLNLEIKPELLRIDYIAREPVEIYINKTRLEKQPEKDKTYQTDLYDYSLYHLLTAKHLNKEENEISFMIDSIDDLLGLAYFSSRIGVQYDHNKLTFARSMEKRHLYSDLSWTTQLADSIGNDFDPEGNVTEPAITTLDLETYQPEDIFSSQAFPIWYPELDTTSVSYVFFFRELEIDVEVLEATARYYAEEEITIWINDIKFVESEKIKVNVDNNQPITGELIIPNLTKGHNEILIGVKSGKKNKGLIFELNYLVQKNNLPTGSLNPEYDDIEIE